MNAQALEAIKNSAAVPSVPQVVTRVLQIMQDPYFDYADVVKALSTDAGTVSEILRLANSAFFGVRQKVVSLRQALTLLGPKRTRSLLLGRYLVESLGNQDVPGLDMSYFWRRSLACGVLSSHLAAQVSPRYREEAFISGLLSDIGLPILSQAMPERCEPLCASYVPNGTSLSYDKEREAVGCSHGEVSAMVLKHWGLPEAITTAVNLSHSPKPGEGDASFVARIVNAADMIAKLLCEIPDVDRVIVICSEAVTMIGAEIDVLVDMLGTVERDIDELADILRIDVIQSNVYSLIVKTIKDQISQPT